MVEALRARASPSPLWRKRKPRRRDLPRLDSSSSSAAAPGRARSTQIRLLSHPALHGVPLLVVDAATDVDSYGGALAREPLPTCPRREPAEIRDLVLRLVRAPTGGARKTNRRRLTAGAHGARWS